MKDRTDRVLDWVWGILAGLVILGLIVLVTTAAHADMPRFVDDDRVASFRTWTEPMQAAYVRGAMHFAIYGGVTCPQSFAVAEYVSALRYSPSIDAGLTMGEAMMTLFLRNGCTVGKKTRTGA